MKKTIYFTVEKEVEIGNEEEYITGNKDLSVYEIIDNKPKLLTTINCGNEENSIELINDYLLDNGFGEDCEIILL